MPLLASDAYKKNFRLLVSNSGLQAHSTSPLPVSFPSIDILLSSPLPAMPLLIHNSFIVNLGPNSWSPTFSTTINLLSRIKMQRGKEKFGKKIRRRGEGTISEDITMPPKEYKIPLIMQRNNLPSLKLRLFRQHTLKKPRNSNPQPRRKIIQNQLWKMTRRISMSRNLGTTLHTTNSEPRTRSIR
jgi:hypothetical protein